MSEKPYESTHGNLINKKETSMDNALLNIQIKDR